MAKKLKLSLLKDEIDIRYKGWIQGYQHDSHVRTKKENKENIEHVRNFIHIKNFIIENVTLGSYKTKICEFISGQKFMMNYPKYFKYEKRKK